MLLFSVALFSLIGKVSTVNEHYNMKRTNIRANETVQQYQARIKEMLLEKIESINAIADAVEMLTQAGAPKYSVAIDKLNDLLQDEKQEAQNLIDDLG